MGKCRPLLVFVLMSPILAAQPAAADSLFHAIQKADTAAVKRLLDAGLDPNLKDAEGTPALMAATLYAGADCVKVLLERGANPNATNPTGATALMWAMPDVAKAKLLIAAGADVNARSRDLQRTPLLIAASYPAAVPVLQMLLDHGADIHAKDRAGVHALGRATLSADVDVVRFLVEHGCDPNEPGYGGNVRYARQYRPTLEYLLSKGAKVEPDALAMAAHWQDSKLISAWIERGADVNVRAGPYKRTALMTAVASEQSSAATVKLLLDKGADPNAEDSDGERPLDWAFYRADKAKAEVLMHAGAMRGHGPRQKTYASLTPETVPDARTAIERAVHLLLPTAPVAFQRRGCISCHGQAQVGLAAAAARSRGIPIDAELAQANVKQIVTAFQGAAERAMQGEQPAGNIVTVGYVMMALGAEQHPADKITAALVHLTAALQLPEGNWTPNGVSRPPMEDSLVSATTLAVRALTLYPMPARKGEVDEKLRRAQHWLLAVNARSAEDRAMRLMGLVWTKASRPQVEAAIRDIVAQQQTDGGWRQRDELETDAYATGITLYALRTAGMVPSEAPYAKGIRFLLETQYPDGAWFVQTRAYPTQPYFESGYPFGSNQWISASGASWATLALAETLPEPIRAAKRE